MMPTVLSDRPYPHIHRGFHVVQPPLAERVGQDQVSWKAVQSPAQVLGVSCMKAWPRPLVTSPCGTALGPPAVGTHLFTCSTASGSRRHTDSSKATDSSAVASVSTSGVYPTRIPLPGQTGLWGSLRVLPWHLQAGCQHCACPRCPGTSYRLSALLPHPFPRLSLLHPSTQMLLQPWRGWGDPSHDPAVEGCR